MTAPRILIIKPSSLGDIIHALPVLAGVRRTWPDAHVAWLVGTQFAPILADHPLIDDLITFDRRRYGSMWYNPAANLAFWRFVGRLRRERFDLVLDLQGLIRSGLMSLFSGAGQRVGFAAAREGAAACYNRRVACPPGMTHAVERNLHLARAVGIDVDPVAFPVAITEDEHRAADEKLAPLAGDAFIAVLPGTRWATKQWPPASFAKLIEQLDRPAVLLGAPDERHLAEQVLAATRVRPLDLVGRTSLRELVAILARADGVVCCDSGPMHIAAALGRPLVALFGPTDATRTGPFSERAVVLERRLSCRPCRKRTCPLQHQACLRELSADVVSARVREHLGSGGGTGTAIDDRIANPL